MRQRDTGSSALQTGGHNTGRAFDFVSDGEGIGNLGKLGQTRAPIQLEWWRSALWSQGVTGNDGSFLKWCACLCVCMCQSLALKCVYVCWVCIPNETTKEYRYICLLGIIITMPLSPICTLFIWKANKKMAIHYCQKIRYIYTTNCQDPNLIIAHLWKANSNGVKWKMAMPNFFQKSLSPKIRKGLLFLSSATLCAFTHTERQKASVKNLFNATAESEKITSPFCQWRFWKRGQPHSPHLSLHLWKKVL